MSIITRMRRQTACYFEPTGDVDPAGQPILETPIELSPPNGVRWDDVQEVFLSTTGQELVSNAKVYVGQPVQIGGVLWKGRLQDLEDWDNPLSNKGAFIIRGYNEIPNLRNTETLRIAIL